MAYCEHWAGTLSAETSLLQVLQAKCLACRAFHCWEKQLICTFSHSREPWRLKHYTLPFALWRKPTQGVCISTASPKLEAKWKSSPKRYTLAEISWQKSPRSCLPAYPSCFPVLSSSFFFFFFPFCPILHAFLSLTLLCFSSILPSFPFALCGMCTWS